MPRTQRRASLTDAERDELHAWLTAEKINPARIRRDFADVKPTATLLSKYYPELVDVNFYPPRNSVTSKMSNWEQFNKRVLTKLGLKLTREDMEQVSRSIPGSIDLLLYKIMKLHNIQRSYEQSGSESEEDVESSGKDTTETDAADATLDAAVTTIQLGTASPLLSEAQSTASATNKSLYSNIDLDSSNDANAASVKAITPTEGGARARKSIAIESNKLLTGMENRNSKYNTKKAHVIKQSSKDGFMIVSLPMKIGDKMRTVTKKLVPINEFNKALRESRRKDAKIEQFHQKLAHLQNLIELKKEHIGELRSKIHKSNGKSGILKHDSDRETGIPSPPTVMSKLSKMNPVVRFNVNVGDDSTTKRKHGGATTFISRRTATATRKTKSSSSTVKRSKPPTEGGVAVSGKSVKNAKGRGKKGASVEKGSGADEKNVKDRKVENEGSRKRQNRTTITAAVTGTSIATNKKPGTLKRKSYRKPIYRPPPRPRSISIVTNNKYACDSLYDEKQ